MAKYINEYVEIKGNVSSLNWIMQFLMARNVSFIYGALTKHLFFVQNSPQTAPVASSPPYSIS
jgi:hypothetical protein